MYKILTEKPSIIWAKSIFIKDRINSINYRAHMIKNKEQINKCMIPLKHVKEIVSFISRGKGIIGKGNCIIPIYKVRNLTNYGINDDVDFIDIEQFNESSQRKLISGDVLLASTGVGSLGKVDLYIKNIDVLVDGHITILRTKAGFDSGYLKSYLQSKYGQVFIEENTLGSTGQTEIYVKDISNILVPIPSPKIQKYIGDKVRKAEELREEAKQLKEEAEQLICKYLYYSELMKELNVVKDKHTWINRTMLNSRFDAEFYKNEYLINIKHLKSLMEYGIKITKMKNIINKGSYGILPKSEDYGIGNIYLIRSTDLGNFKINYDKLVKVPEKYLINKAIVEKGNILLEIKGQCATGAIYDGDANKCIVNGSIYNFNVKDEYNNYYILAYLLSISGKIQKKQNFANSIISYLSIDCINDLNIPVIEKAKQDEIRDIIKHWIYNENQSKSLIQEAKKDVEDLIEGNFNMAKLKTAN